MSELDISYKGANILSLNDSDTRTLLTAGKYCEDDIIVDYNRPVSTVPFVIRPDAEFVQSFTYDKLIVEDEGVTLPGYVTSAKSLKASVNLSPTISFDANTFRYLVVEKSLSIPIYNTTAVGKGRVEYQWSCNIFEYARVLANTLVSLDGSNKKLTSAQNLWTTNQLYRMFYWSSTSAVGLVTTNAYGAYQTASAPTISGSSLTIKSPILYVRGSTSYFTSTYMNALTDIRFQYVIDVYRAPYEVPMVSGWEQEQILQHILNCVNSTDHKLT